MSMRTQLRGVLEVVTPSGVYYLTPSLRERLYLVWMFRNFRNLPLGVLSEPQRKKIEAIASKRGTPDPHASDEILGTIDCTPVMKKPVQPIRAPQFRHSARV